MKVLRANTVEGVNLALDELYALAKEFFANNPDGKGLVLQMKSTDWATWEQRKRIKAMCGELAKQAMLHGQKLDKDSWSAVLIAGLRKDQKVVQGLEGGLVMIGGSTRDLNRREASDVIEMIYELGSRQEPPVVFKEPKA
jgi:hypothetical protein